MPEVKAPLDATLRELRGLAECRECVELQKLTWGEDFEERVPASILLVARKSGGIVAGALDPEDRLLGFVFGIAGVEDGRPYHWSHMLAVRPEARGSGLGVRLKLFQRELLLGRGVTTAVWTFDPLVSRNAHLNLNRLGVEVSGYVVNMYGDTGSSLHGGLETDRLLVRWELDSPRVRRAIASPRVPRFEEFGEGACALRVDDDDGAIVARDLPLDGSPVLIEIPGDFPSLLESDADRSRLWRRRSRTAFLRCLRAGYQVDALCERPDPDRYYYVLRPGARRPGAVDGPMSRDPILPPDPSIAGHPDRKYNVERMALPQITWDDVLQMPDDGNRYEAIEGELYVTAAPSSRHQEISVALTVALHGILVAGEHGRLFHAPYGVKFPSTGEGVQPDLVFVSTARQGIVGSAQIEGAPDLVVEILSPSTESRDRGVKRKLYQRQGVPEYWIVDADADAVDVWRFEGGKARCERFTDRLPVRLEEEAVGEIQLADIFGHG